MGEQDKKNADVPEKSTDDRRINMIGFLLLKTVLMFLSFVLGMVVMGMLL